MSTQDQTAARSSIEEPTHDEDQAAEPGGDDARGEEAEREELSLDLTFEILKNSRRREVLHYLRDSDPGERVPLGELAEHVAAIENDTTTEALTSSQRKRVYVGLYQCHLPKMDDMGVVDFNQDRGHVTLAAAADDLTEYLDRPATDDSVDWYQYYGVISLVGIAVLALSVGAGLAQSMTLPLLGLVVGTFAFCAGCHWVTERNADD